MPKSCSAVGVFLCHPNCHQLPRDSKAAWQNGKPGGFASAAKKPAVCSGRRAIKLARSRYLKFVRAVSCQGTHTTDAQMLRTYGPVYRLAGDPPKSCSDAICDRSF